MAVGMVTFFFAYMCSELPFALSLVSICVRIYVFEDCHSFLYLWWTVVLVYGILCFCGCLYICELKDRSTTEVCSAIRPAERGFTTMWISSGTVCLYVKWLMVRYVMVSLRFDAGNALLILIVIVFGDTDNWRFSSMRWYFSFAYICLNFCVKLKLFFYISHDFYFSFFFVLLFDGFIQPI